MLKMLKLYKFSAATIKMFNFLATHTSCMQQQHVLVNASELSNINEAETTEKSISMTLLYELWPKVWEEMHFNDTVKWSVVGAECTSYFFRATKSQNALKIWNLIKSPEIHNNF